MTERFQRHLAESGLVPDGATVLLGYSGGADSTCLLHLLHALKVDLIAAHLHHGQRAEADEELRMCSEACERIGVPFVSGRADVPGMSRELGVGLEEAGREARYAFFEQSRRHTGADLVATAHTMDDLVESVLLNLARGAGPHGLAGIPAQRGEIVRPLLPFLRAETRDYCERHKLWFHDDPANDDESLSRVKVRKLVVPVLETINPEARGAIARAASLVGEEDRFLDGMAAAALERCEVPLNGPLRFLTVDCEAAFDKAALLTLPRVLLSRAVRLATGSLGAALDYDQTSIAVTGMATQEKGSVTAEGGQVVVEWDSDLVTVRDLATDAPYRHPLTVPGVTESEAFGWAFTAEGAGPNGYEREPKSLDVVIDLGAVKGQLYFRTYESGDSVQPLGLGGTKKVGAVLSESGLTEAAKRRLPIVCDMVGPVWVPGGCIAERAKVTGQSQRCLRLRFGPTEPEPS